MWPLDSANTVSLTPRAAMSSAGSRTIHGSTVNVRPGSGLISRRLSVEQLGEVADDDVSAVRAQLGGVPEAVDADDEPEPARAAGLHPGDRVLEHDGLLLGDGQVRRRREERVGRGLAR